MNVNLLKAAEIKGEPDMLFNELEGSQNLADRTRIEAGTRYENPVILNRNDAYGQLGIWKQSEISGFWRILLNEGRYNLRFRFLERVHPGGKIIAETGSCINQMRNNYESDRNEKCSSSFDKM